MEEIEKAYWEKKEEERKKKSKFPIAKALIVMGLLGAFITGIISPVSTITYTISFSLLNQIASALGIQSFSSAFASTVSKILDAFISSMVFVVFAVMIIGFKTKLSEVGIHG